MQRLCLLVFTLVLFSCHTTVYYISRHGEKAGAMAGDPPLTTEGEKQALDLRNYVSGKKIGAIYSTTYVRTMATATPTAELYHLSVNAYNAAGSVALMDSLKLHNRRNVLVIGHSNTVDDMVNRLMDSTVMNDLPDTAYGSLFIVKKKGCRYSFEKITVPQTAQR